MSKTCLRHAGFFLKLSSLKLNLMLILAENNSVRNIFMAISTKMLHMNSLAVTV